MHGSSRRLASVVILAGVWLGFGLVHEALASRDPEPPLEPTTYESPSKHYSLFVDPTERQGSGPGRHRLKKDSREVWSKELPFTLREARVFDDGTVAGYAYTHGPMGRGKSLGDYDDVVIAILDPTGTIRGQETFARAYGPSQWEDQYPPPLVDALVADPENDRLLVLLSDPDVNAQDTRWRVYRVSTGKFVEEFRPKRAMSERECLNSCFAPRPVPGTPLVLAQWHHNELRSGRRTGAHYALIDPHGRPVWQETRRDEYALVSEDETDKRVWAWVLRNSAILSVERPGRFDLYFAKEGQRVSFAATQDKTGNWTVKETAREPFELPADASRDAESARRAVAKTFSKKSLDYLGAIRLGDAGSAAGPLGNEEVFGFAVDDKGRFILTRRQAERKVDLVRVDQQGRVVDRLALPTLTSEWEHWLHAAWLGGDRFVVVASQPGQATNSRAVFVDFGAKKVAPLASFDCPAVEAITALPGGGFVVLAREWLKYTMSQTLRAYDAKGRPQWTADAPMSASDICVTADGLVAVVSSVRDNVTLYDRSGQPAGEIDLKAAWGRDPQYPADIVALSGGEFIVGDAVASGGPFVRMSRDGKIIKEFRVHLADGQQIAQRLTAGPDGRLWSSHGPAFLELDNTGAAKRVIGQAPSAERLQEIETAAADAEGNIYALDAKTFCVHAFTADGKRRFVCRPKPSDAQVESHNFKNVTDAGEILVGRPDARTFGDPAGYVRYAADGRRLGIAPALGLDSITEEWHCQPGTGRRWVECFQSVALVDSDGHAIKTIERRPTGGWLHSLDEIAVAPDGALAVAESGIYLRDRAPTVDLYSAEGDPLCSLDSPEPMLASLAYSGKWIAATSYNGPLYLWDTRGKPLLQTDLGNRLTRGQRRFLFFSPDGTELRVLDGPTQTVHRFAMPAGEAV